ATGIVGKIRSAIENFFLDEDSLQAYALSSGSFQMAANYCPSGDYPCVWSLNQYKNTVDADQAEAWDELEKSVIASVADDILVGVKGNRADIVIVKKFA
ncbi:MAG: hypothetical protein IKT68_00050, partial [Clostridia bacterium]|nr:hypothetical protein [Clostridia bacterium]